MARSKHLQNKYSRAYRQRKREARLREREAHQALLGPPPSAPISNAERMRNYRLRKKLSAQAEAPNSSTEPGQSPPLPAIKGRKTSAERMRRYRMRKKLTEQAEPKKEFEYQKRMRMKVLAEPEVEVHFVPSDRTAMACDPLATVKLELSTDADPMDPGASTSAIQTIKQEPDPELSTPALDGFFGPAALWESLQNVPDPVTEPDQEGAPRGRKNPTVTLDSIKKELTYECELCGKRFRKSADFFQHKLTHGEELKCADCDERFFRTWDLEKHRVEKHSDSEIYKCDTCSKTFIEHWRLLRHQRTHSTEKKFKCDMCDKSFTESGNLAKHKKQVHTKDRPFSCEICSKSYPQKKDLQGHMLVHTMKRFACTVCQEEFSLLDEKRAHMRELHPNETVEKTFTCTVCEATFNSKLKHSSHVLTHGERRFECQFCMKKFHTNARVRKHMKSHRVELYSKCHICDKCFSQDCNLKRHIEQMHMQGDRYSCLHCTALFDSADELRGHRESEHQNEHPYKCPCCPKAFAFHQSLVNHAKCHNNPKRHLQEFIKPSPRKRKQQQPKEASDGTEVAVKKRGRPKKKIVVMPEPEFVDLMETVMLRETVPIKVECDAGEHAEPAQLDSSELVSEIKVESTIFEETETTDKTCLI
ncbi:zinc finger protein 629-like isoform X2 [Culex pipiens pallens]|uniref:zinc finger protein 629-like isoform X2 n=1 Tax=Culex pipiens pallens TaxID=42434 RepID=UPI001954A682|nr:zinc finger protein 629-like isoform X2 [Culex pipiens pallens]XP_052566540.1 zinc finger protein 629-like isoform X2 [Culex pipiens pallens]